MVLGTLRPDSLVLFKNRPARVVQAGEKLEIELQEGGRARVRPKDVALLHPGPLRSLAELRPLAGEVESAWEILRDDPAAHDLAELAELAFGAYTPATAWAVWQWVEDGLYFHGTPQSIAAHGEKEVERQKAARQARLAQQQAWMDFIERAKRGTVSPQADQAFLREVEDLALGRRQDSRTLRELGRAEKPHIAHALLLEWGYWDSTVDPYPIRMRLPLTPPEIGLPPLPDEPRLDLTHLPAYAIDDRYNQDPDDALSLMACQLDAEGQLLSARLWVHVADVAALIQPDSPADLEARARGSTLYLPECTAPMLPLQAIAELGLGLKEISPALSFNLEITANGEIGSVEMQPSWVRVGRLSYEQAEERIAETPFRELSLIAQVYQARRQANGALSIDLPEVILHVVDEQVSIRPALRLLSRNLVREAMIMAGEAAARFAIDHHIPFPFVTQDPPSLPQGAALPTGLPPEPAQAGTGAASSLAGIFALRRMLKRSQVSGFPGLHAGAGLPAYCRVTSPLRRYLDLAAHQQLRAFLRGQELLSQGEMLERVGASEAAIENINQAEALARRHWTLVYLQQHPGWQGEGVLVERRGSRVRLILPELAFETHIHLRRDLPLDSRLPLKLKGVNLPELEAYF